LSTVMNATRGRLIAVRRLMRELSSMIMIPGALNATVHFHPTKAHGWELQNYAM
jgi:hypothetical protein